MLNTEELINKEKLYHLSVYKRLPVIFVRGEGTKLWDNQGRKYTDFVSGLGVVNLGHCRTEVLQAFCHQAQQLTHVSNLFYTFPQVELAEKLVNLSLGASSCFFANSGAEANEGAIKLARRWGKINFSEDKIGIVTAWHSFHGRTLSTLAATGQADKQKPFQPLPNGFTHVAYNDISALEKAVNENTCAVMLEVVQGEGGVYPSEPGYLQAVSQLCRRRDLLLIIDEVQTGIGRTGSLFAYQQYGIKPDIITLAKSLANGLPIGALIANNQVSKAFTYGDHGSTFGGNPVVCAAALKTLEILEKEDLLEAAKRLGKYFQQQLNELKSNFPLISEVRGRGLMLGFELAKPIAAQIVLDMLAKGFIINNIGDKIIRFLPPLVISKLEIDEMLSGLADVLAVRK